MKILKSIAKPFTALAGKVDDAVTRKILMSVARKGALLLGAWLVSKGYLDSNHVAEFAGYVVGLVSVLSGAQNAANHG